MPLCRYYAVFGRFSGLLRVFFSTLMNIQKHYSTFIIKFQVLARKNIAFFYFFGAKNPPSAPTTIRQKQGENIDAQTKSRENFLGAN